MRFTKWLFLLGLWPQAACRGLPAKLSLSGAMVSRRLAALVARRGVRLVQRTTLNVMPQFAARYPAPR